MASLCVPSRPRFNIKLHLKNTPREVLLQDLQRVARQNGGRSPSREIYDEHGNFSAGALAHRFGSWNGALKAAGLPILKPYKVSEAELFDNLVQLWRELGRQPRSMELGRSDGPSRYSKATYSARFGSWNKALQAFDAYVNRGKKPKEPKEPKQRSRRKPLRVKCRSRNISWRLRATVLLRDKCACRMCGASPAKDPAVSLHIDHIKPWAKGGATALHNLQTLCSACNIGKSDRSCPRPKSPGLKRKTSPRSSGARRSSPRRPRR